MGRRGRGGSLRLGLGGESRLGIWSGGYEGLWELEYVGGGGGGEAEMALGIWGLNMGLCVASRILEMLAMKGRLLLHMNRKG